MTTVLNHQIIKSGNQSTSTKSPDHQIVGCACSARVSDFREQALVLSQNDIPPILAADVIAAVAAEGGAQALVANEQTETLDEFVAVGVVETGIAPHAV